MISSAFFSAHAGTLRMVAAAALAAALGVQTLRIAHLQERLAVQQSQYSKAAQAAAEMQAKTEAEYRKREASLQSKVDEASNELSTEKAKNSRALAAAMRDADSLRQRLSAYAAGPVDTSADTIAACRARADRLGLGLAAVLRDYAEATDDAEIGAAHTRALLRAWPSATAAGDSQ